MDKNSIRFIYEQVLKYNGEVKIIAPKNNHYIITKFYYIEHIKRQATEYKNNLLCRFTQWYRDGRIIYESRLIDGQPTRIK